MNGKRWLVWIIINLAVGAGCSDDEERRTQSNAAGSGGIANNVGTSGSSASQSEAGNGNAEISVIGGSAGDAQGGAGSSENANSGGSAGKAEASGGGGGSIGAPHLIFLTSQAYSGDLVGEANTLVSRGAISAPDGGTFKAVSWKAAADAICTFHAQQSHREGTFRALVQTGSDDAFSGISDADGPWALTNGSAVANTVADLRAGRLFSAVDVTETAIIADQNLGEGFAWGKGEATHDCNHWSSALGTVDGMVGSFSEVLGAWLAVKRPTCDEKHPLYCLQVGAGAGPNVLPKLPPNPKLAFYTGPMPGDFAKAAVLASGPDALHTEADARCTKAAADAGMSGTFRAWTSSSTRSAKAHFTGLGMTGPWHRADGFLIARDLAQLTSDNGTTAPIVLGADGKFAGYHGAWTGTEQDGSSSTRNCENFTSTTSSTGILAGTTSQKGRRWASSSGAACNISYFGLFCFQQ